MCVVRVIFCLCVQACCTHLWGPSLQLELNSLTLTHRHRQDDVAFVRLSRADICVCGKGRFGVSEYVLNVSSIWCNSEL